jgi:hypothetical protein
MLTLEEHNNYYKELHKQNKFQGYSLLKWIPDLSNLIRNSNIETVLDFGCGEAKCWKEHKLSKILGVKTYALYDPGVPEFSKLTKYQYDMVICIDVLEHIPEHLLDIVLEQIISRAKKAVFLAISTRPASKLLPNGQNAHATIKNKNWWLEKLSVYDNKLIITHFD